MEKEGDAGAGLAARVRTSLAITATHTAILEARPAASRDDDAGHEAGQAPPRSPVFRSAVTPPFLSLSRPCPASSGIQWA